MRRAIRTLLAVVARYALMVVMITLVQKGLYGGVSYAGSTMGVLISAGLLTVLCAGAV